MQKRAKPIAALRSRQATAKKAVAAVEVVSYASPQHLNEAVKNPVFYAAPAAAPSGTYGTVIVKRS